MIRGSEELGAVRLTELLDLLKEINGDLYVTIYDRASNSYLDINRVSVELDSGQTGEEIVVLRSNQ